ncbi:MAG: CsgG/HfaB family protein [Salinibacter sp.]|uniref:CsgG/HfaB family protein n=1 Tax=Salinibacter sp. TaxID=2065818 RepID=UPI0035D47D6D
MPFPLPLRSVPAHLLLAATVLIVGSLACAPQAKLREDPEDYQDEVARLQRKIAENPGDTEALRDLGVIYVRTKRAAKGHKYLRKAFAQDQDDPKTLFYLGIASERIGKRQTAQRLYARYADVPEDSRFRTLLRGRYEWLLRQEVRRKMEKLRAREDTLAMSPNVVAVLPLAYQGDNQRYAPLSRGLSEMIAVDLAAIGELTLVERTRLQALLDELKLAQSKYVDPSTAPRVGQLLGAGRLVGGAFNVLDGETLRTDVTLAELGRAPERPDLKTRSGALEELFRLEREIVFGVVDRLGVELSPKERRQIERAPTRNLQAFLAYSRGLEAEARGNYGAAAEAFRRAHELDPDFSRAADKQEEAAGLSAAGGRTEQALLAAVRMGRPPRFIDLGRNRQRMQGLSLGMPASEERQPAAEFNNVILRDPPQPPSSGGSSP